MAGSNQPFRAYTNTTVTASTVASTTTLAAGGEACLVTNFATVAAYVAFGGDTTSSAATVAASFPVPAGASRLINIGTLASFAGVILPSGTTASVVFSRGDGSVY
jgi:hypothetical protein